MKRFKNILFFAEGSTEMNPALQRAQQLADSNNARITLVDVIEPVETPSEVRSHFNVELGELLTQHREQELQALAESINRESQVIYTRVLSGIPFVEIIKFVQSGGFDLLIKMAHPPAGMSEKLFGSIDLHLLRKCPCPVLIERPDSAPSFNNILAAVDTDSSADQGSDNLVMQLATSLAQQDDARLDIVHAWHLQGESMFRGGRFRLPSMELESLLKHQAEKQQTKLIKLIEPFGFSADDDCVHLVKGQPAESINDTVSKLKADIIVMGTVGRVGIPGLFIGNTAEEVFQTTTCSVLAVKPAGFKSPVK